MGKGHSKMSKEQTEEDVVVWTLDTLPIEVLLHITQFIPASDLIHSVALVSKYFQQVLTNEKSWQIRAQKKWPGKFPPIDVPEDKLPPRFHRMSNQSRESTLALWSSPKLLSFAPHIACVDAVHLFKGNSMLASGSRDRCIALINLDQCIQQEKTDFALKNNAHAGWIWDFCGVGCTELLASAGWDRKVKYWDLETFESVGGFDTTSACLCLSSEENLITCGTFDSKVQIYDTRTKQKVTEYKKHKRSVLSIGLENHKIVSCSEDNLVVLFDLKMNKVAGRLQLAQPAAPPKTYPKSISYGKTGNYALPQFYIGDIRGNLYLINLNTFQIERIYPSVHSKSIQGVFHTLGAVFTCSADGQMIIHEPSLELRPVHRVSVEKVELPKVHCLNNRLALAGGDSIVRVYYNN